MEGDDAGVAADVAELVVVGAGQDAAAEAAHEAEAGGGVNVQVLRPRGRRHGLRL